MNHFNEVPNIENTVAQNLSRENPSGDPCLNLHQRHGQLGRGQKSEAGKAASAKNSTKHGLSGQSFVLLPNERTDAFDELLADFEQAFHPQDPYEHDLVREMVEARWLINRSKEMERTALRLEIQRFRLKKEHQKEDYLECQLTWLATENLIANNKAFANIPRYRAQHERTLLRTQRALESHRKNRSNIPQQSVPLERIEIGTQFAEIEEEIIQYKTKPLQANTHDPIEPVSAADNPNADATLRTLIPDPAALPSNGPPR